MKLVRTLLILPFFLVFGHISVRAATLLPNGKQCFEGANGAYVSGSVNMFIPNTTSPKATYQDAAQTVLNSQPIQLDSNGCAIIYGTGSYRQQLFDGPVVTGVTTGNLIWDQITTDTSASNSVFWAGVAGGTPNAITITDPGFNGTDGTVVNFTANATNTGAATINPSGFGAISVLKDTSAGPAALTGGEIIQTNPISVIYRANDNAFHLLNTVQPATSAGTSPLCSAIGYRASNNASFPNTRLDYAADGAVVVNGIGGFQNSGFSGTINFGVNGLNGLDVGSIQANSVYHIWLISSAATGGAIASLSFTAPVLPTGFTFRCRFSAVPTDGSSRLYPITTRGAETQFQSNASLPSFISSAGTCFGTFSAQFFGQIPTTATFAAARVTVAPSQSGALGASASGPILSGATTVASQSVNQYVRTAISGQTLFYCSSDNSGNSNLAVLGWTDGVNAH
jgi:hypothetical protein